MVIPKSDLAVRESEPSEGFSCSLEIEVAINAPADVLFKLLSNIKEHHLFFPEHQFRFDSDNTIQEGKIYYAKERDASQWKSYRFWVVTQNTRMGGELIEGHGIFKQLRYDHRLVTQGDQTLSIERIEYQLSYGLLGEFINWVYAREKIKAALHDAHQRLKSLAEQKADQLRAKEQQHDTSDKIRGDHLLVPDSKAACCPPGEQKPTTEFLVVHEEELFKEYIVKGSTWSTIKQRLIFDAQANASQNVRLREMEALIKYRDILDFVIYRKALEAIFPPHHFTFKIMIRGTIERSQDCLCPFTSTQYDIRVFNNKDDNQQIEEQAICQIKINAPGSRTMTSDIDTSIFSESSPKFNFTSSVARVHNRGPAYDERVVNAVIDGFYRISEALHGITSGENRDSNAYMNITTRDDLEHPKFNNTINNNPLINGEPLFDNREFLSMFYIHKRLKHLLEFAASLFSLRLTFTPTEWTQFKAQTFEQIKQLYHHLSLERAPYYFKKTTADLELIFHIVDHFFIEYEIECTFMMNAKRNSQYAQNSPLKDEPSKLEKDLHTSMLNDLYVKYLELMGDTSNQMAHLVQIDITNTLAKLADTSALTKSPGPDTTIPYTPASTAACREDRIGTKMALKTLYRKLAALKNQRQALKIKAHLFANEAYINRSAVYHVVKGMQESSFVRISEQTLLGSAMHQIGFRLLHADSHRKEGKPESEVAYLTAKYSARVFDLIFSGLKRYLTTDELTLMLQDKTTELRPLGYLKSPNLRQKMVHFLSAEELYLLNSEMKIVVDIKKGPFSDQEKPVKTLNILRERLQYFEPQKFQSQDQIQEQDLIVFAQRRERQVFLSIIQKLIGFVYGSRLYRKQSLWGGNHDVTLECWSTTKNEDPEHAGITIIDSMTAASISLTTFVTQETLQHVLQEDNGQFTWGTVPAVHSSKPILSLYQAKFEENGINVHSTQVQPEVLHFVKENRH